MKTPKYEEEAKAVLGLLPAYAGFAWNDMNRSIQRLCRRIAQAVIKAHEKKNKP